MKKTLLLACVLFFGIVKPKAQVLLNEIYTDPSVGNHEFFELYNTSTANAPFSMDHYSIVTYFDISGTKGFYVLDLPNLFINPRGYFVGSSAIPFNFQGTMGSTASDFSWNSVAFTANNGYLKKWVQGGLNVLDGNLSYDQAALPGNFNDFFYRRTGVGSSYTIFLYNNGQLINTFLGGTGGQTSIISAITSMPALNVDMINPASTDYTINFSGYGSLPVEYCGQDAGSDNGFIRNRDGTCGFWDKSSASVQHTPKLSNGSIADQFTGSISVSSSLTIGTPASGSTVTYDVVSAPAGSFSVTMEVYLDLGSVVGKLDATDVFVEAKSQSALSDPARTTVFLPYDANVLIVVKSAAGCIDKIQFIPGAKLLSVTQLTFQGSYNDNQIQLNWNVPDNETIDRFEMEKSSNGKDFTRIAVIPGSDKMGKENYAIYENTTSNQKVFYRLKVIDNAQKAQYSKVLVFETKEASKTPVNIIVTNPIMDKLTVSFMSLTNQPASLIVYDLNGRKILNHLLNAYEGNNMISVPVSSTLKKGLYIAEINAGAKRYTSKFVKQ